jgi:heat-inducible transcriptional repressor
VYQQRIYVPENVSFRSIEQLMNLLNYRLKGTPLSKLRLVVKKELAGEMMKHIDHFEELMDTIDQVFSTLKTEERVYKSGTSKILDQPEFRDVEKVKSLLTLFEENQQIIQLLEPSTTGVQIRIGSEHQLKSVNHCSIISASYTIDGEPVGTIGVIGPLRMDYSKVVGLVDYLASDVSSILRSIYK